MWLVRPLFALALLAAALVLQVSVLARLPLPGATPDLVLVAVVALAFAWGRRFGAVSGFVAGLGLDLVPPADAAVGRWALVLGLIGYGSGLAATRLRRSAFLAMIVVSLAAAVSVVGYAATGVLAGDSPVPWGAANRLIPTAVLYAVVLSAFIVSAVLAVVRRLEPADQGRRVDDRVA